MCLTPYFTDRVCQNLILDYCTTFFFHSLFTPPTRLTFPLCQTTLATPLHGSGQFSFFILLNLPASLTQWVTLPLLKNLYSGARFGSTYTKIGTIQRRLAWPLRKDDTQIREAFHIKKKKKKKICTQLATRIGWLTLLVFHLSPSLLSCSHLLFFSLSNL